VVFVPVRDLHLGTTMVALTRADETSKIVAAFLATLMR
jgi:hypothetical protein